MWPVPSRSTPSLVAPVSSSVLIDDPNSFSRAGRKIHVGDCVLFKLPQESLPFVGIVRRLIAGKEENPSLCVNWFYRPADVKLGKGALLEAAPNEVFYSFHEDEISAASVLHPCKVAFLSKGVELPSGISSFVCRRVYDIENKCLWWLTDQNYINEQQEELDQLLDKTRAEMHGAVQTGGRSPKPLNGPNGTTQNNSSVSSLAKSKKREHGVHSPDSVKRERLSKPDDADSGLLRPEHMLKTEIAKITDKGGLVDFEGVEKLIQLMQPESAEKKVDLVCRVMLVDVISVTDRFDCLGRFVQLRGLLILDEWLQEVHKGKIGDGSPKGSDKPVEEFLFALLRALDRLPVNLHALQTCNVGKSVNHLRSHKNSEIQKKARSLVDTWKKRVEAEMNIIETRSGTRRGGSWPNKSMMSDVSPMGTRRISGSSDVDVKISTMQPSVRSGEANAKSPESPVSTRVVAPAAAGAGSSDVPVVTIKEEKSSSSSPSANNSQCYSSDHGKTGASCKEDAPSATSGPLSVNKNPSGVSHSRKSSNVAHGQKEGGLGKFSSVNRNFASGRGSPDASFGDNVNNTRLIVRLPNAGRSPARTASGGSLEDASTTFGKSSPLVHSEKQDHDTKARGKVDVLPATSTESHQGKDELAGSDEVKKAGIAGVPHDEHGQDGEVTERSTEASKGTVSVNVSTQAGDDVGMNLLASVAAGEISSSENKPRLLENTLGNEAKLSQPGEDGCQSEDKQVVPHVDSEKMGETNAQLDSRLSPGGNAVVTGPDVKPAEDDSLRPSMDATNASKEGDNKEEKNPGCASEKVTVSSDLAATNVNVETQTNDESPSLSSSSEMHVVEKKSSSKNLVKGSEQSEKPNLGADQSVLLRSTEKSNENIDKNKVIVQEGGHGPCSDEPSSSTHASEMAVKLDFDLNEVLPNDDGIQGEFERSLVSSHVHAPSLLPSTSSLVPGHRPAAAKGPFFPSENLLRGKAELGWKGSAATSAFRPAEPRKSDNSTSKQPRPLLDFDLNVGAHEDVGLNSRNRNVGRLDLDLNACEESPDVGSLSVSFTRPSIPQLQPRSLLSSRFSNLEPNPSRGFDLNNGPGGEETGGESMPLSRNGLQFLPAVPSVRMNNMDMGNFSSWFPAITVPPVLRGEQSYPMAPATSSQRMLPPATSLNPEIYRGPVLSSSPAVAFPSTTPFQFPGFPFETSFSIPSNTFSAGSSGAPLCFPVGPSGVVSTTYRPYLVSLPGGSSNMASDGRKWGSQGLDLNSGPGGGELERRDDTFPPSGLRQLPQAVADEQLKMFQQMAAGGGGALLKRKEPDDGWDADRISYKHPSWQ